MVEKGRWMKPRVQYIDKKCTLCNDNDIQDEYHIVLKCAYYNEVRRKYIKPYYHRHPSIYGSQMWQVNSQYICNVCTSWNKDVRRILNLPHDAHTWLIGPLLKQNHI